MIGSVVFTNLNTVSITMNNDGGPYPITGWDPTIDQEIERNNKAGQDGLWPSFDSDGGMEIAIEGAILANDSDDYTTKRNALTTCLRYKPAVKQRRSGILVVTFDGAAENVTADVSLVSNNIPRTGASPNYSEFRLVFLSFLPYWVGVTSGNPYYDI